MKNILQLTVLVLTSLLTVGCFEVLEEIDLNEDGSGKFKFTVNFSQSAPTINTLMLRDEVDGHKVPTENKIKSEFYNISQLTKSVDGISQVYHTSDFNDYIFVYSCEFKSCQDLNNLIDTVKVHHKYIDNLGENYFSFDNQTKVLERKGDDLLKRTYQKMKSSQQIIFNDAMYTSVYRFKTEVDSVDNINVKLSPSKKAIMHKFTILKLIYNTELINKTIKLK